MFDRLTSIAADLLADDKEASVAWFAMTSLRAELAAERVRAVSGRLDQPFSGAFGCATLGYAWDMIVIDREGPEPPEWYAEWFVSSVLTKLKPGGLLVIRQAAHSSL